MLVCSVIYGWGFDFMRPFQKSGDALGRHFVRKLPPFGLL